jgi:hypothetical protein
MSEKKKVPLQGLEIAKLDDTGNASRRINCLPGRITVLRSVRPMEAKLYEEALSGQHHATNFQILFQGQPFVPSEATVVGAGNDFSQTDGTVTDFITKSGANSEARKRILDTVGLEGMEQANCCDLSKAQQRAIRLLTVPLSPQKPAILVDPFNHLPKPLLEIIAKELVEYVSTELALIVVPKLVIKPDAWIENEYVSRAQLERPRQATVGFGSDAISRDELLEQMKKEGIPRRNSQVLGVDLTAVDLGDRKKGSRHVARLFVLAVALGGALIFGSSLLDKPKTPQQTAVQTSVITPPIQAEEQSEEADSYKAYPTEVTESVMAAFMRPDEILKQNSQAFAPVKAADSELQEQSSEPTQRYEQNNGAMSDTPPSEESQEEMAERRRQIYERFMEAINRARAAQESPAD